MLTVATCSAAGAALSLVPKSASAETSGSTPATQLLLPTSYEQYLDLTAPTDVAVCEDYTAIADGNVIYVYDKTDGVYREYVHEVNPNDPSKNNVTKLQFDGAGDLYFLDATYLYVLKPETLELPTPTVQDTKFPCTSFYLHKNMLYFTDVKPSHTQLSQLDVLANGIDVNKSETLINSLKGKPTITVYQNELYYTEDNTISKYSFDTNTTTPVAWLSNQMQVLTSVQIVDDVLCCTDNAQNFYAYNLLDVMGAPAAEPPAPLFKTQGSFSALSVFEGGVYAVDGNIIRLFSVTDLAFTGYEISNKSASQNRIGGVTDSCLVGDVLMLADVGNHRISLCDVQTGEFLTPIQNTLTVSYLVSDGSTVLAANADKAILYSMQTENYGAVLAEFDNFIGNIVGAASVYGKYYLALDNYCHYLVEADETGVWNCAETKRVATRQPSLLTADVYGNLYVASGSKIHRYTEEQFLSIDQDGEEVYGNLPQAATKIMVDYAGNLYALIDNQLFKLGEEKAYPLNNPLVYVDTATPTSFAFGIENNETYLVYQENYVAKTTLLNLPTVKTIAVGETDDKIFAKESATFSVVQTIPDALVVYFDIHTLQGAEVFPYLSYERRAQPFTALKIGETETHNALALFNDATHEYQTCLVLKTQCQELPAEEYRADYETEKIGYLSNAVSLYKFPYLNSALTASRLNAGTEIVLLGEIDKLDHPYYHVAFADENGVRQTGFVPKAYVTLFNGAPPVPETEIYGGTEDNNDSIYRLCYLILGMGVVCILVDLIILRKRKNDEDEK